MSGEGPQGVPRRIREVGSNRPHTGCMVGVAKPADRPSHPFLPNPPRFEVSMPDPCGRRESVSTPPTGAGESP